MAAATEAIDTPERPGQSIAFPVAAATIIYAGTLVALDASGNAVPADDAAALRVVGRCEGDVDNSDGDAGDLNVTAKRGVFKFANSSGDPVAEGDKGKICFVEDDSTVASDSTNKCKAGRVLEVESDGVWIDTTDAIEATQVYALVSTDGVAAAAGADLPGLAAEAELIGDDVRAIHAALVAVGILA